jgi:hypothetical protein
VRYFRFFILLFCLCALSCWFLLVKRTLLVEQAIKYQLKALGATNIELAIHDIKLGSASISSLQVSFPDEFPLQFLSLRNLVLHYQASELFKGSLSKLAIDTATVSFVRLDKPDKSKTFLPLQKIRSYIPDEVSIKELHVSTPQLNTDLFLQVSLTNKLHQPLALWTTFSAETLLLKQMKISGLHGELFLQTEDAQNITIQNKSYLEVKEVQNDATTIEKSRFQFSAQVSKGVDHSEWIIPVAKVAINTQGIHLPEISLHPGSLSIEMGVQFSPFQTDLSLTNKALFLQFKDKGLALKDIQLQLNSTNNNQRLGIQLSHAIIPGRLVIDISHNSQISSGKAIFSTSSPFDLHGDTYGISHIIKGLNFPLKVSAGLVNSKGTINWSENTLKRIQGSFSLRNGAGSYGSTTVTGLLIQQDLELFPKVSSRSPGYLSASAINNGLTLKNFFLKNQFLASDDSSLPTLLLDSIQAEIFGGIIRSKDIYVDLQHPEINCIVDLERIDLEEIIKLQKMKGLQVSGILDGEIHAQWKNNQLNIHDGELHSRTPGGTITYLPPGGSDGYSTLPAYALKALEEFNYDTLIATPTYDNDGTLRINIQTKGNSPPLKTNRPVHLNLNTEQNILSLLQSLGYSQNLTNELEQRLQKN